MKTPPLSADGHTALLALPITAVLATKNPDGTPRMTPLVFEAQPDDTILFNTFEDSAAVKNLRRDASCSVLIDNQGSYADGVDPGYGIHYNGTATVHGPENDRDGMGKMFTPYVDGQVDKARAYADVMISYGNRVYVSFRPNREVNWDFRMG